MDNLAPGVMSNILVHGVGMALIPIMTFFMLHWMGFSGVWCAISKSRDPLFEFRPIYKEWYLETARSGTRAKLPLGTRTTLYRCDRNKMGDRFQDKIFRVARFDNFE